MKLASSPAFKSAYKICRRFLSLIARPHLTLFFGLAMKDQLTHWLSAALNHLSFNIPVEKIQITPTKDATHGDFSTNIALILAKGLQRTPQSVAQDIVNHLAKTEWIEKVEIAGPGFINIFLQKNYQHSIIKTILQAKEQFGRSQIGNQKKVLVEFVSANPTGPLHVGHGRGAAYGATLADLLAAAGFDVHREYYVNDAGRQMNILATSVWLRALELLGEKITFPRNGYQGNYVIAIAKQFIQDQGKTIHRSAQQVFVDLPMDESQDEQGNICGDKETYIDAMIIRAQILLGTLYNKVFNTALHSVLDDIKQDLAEFGVDYQQWFSENTLMASNKVHEAIDRLKASNHLYQKEGAWWFKSTDFGDDKDRVVLRDNGQPTYFATDIAYHMNKFDRGFHSMINIWGADHHGYILRVKAAIQALGYNPEQLTVLLVQFAILWRGEARVSMSTRSGSFVTLRELRDEVGNDAARYFYASRKCEQHLDFDLALAKSSSKDNPVYYIQYAHARVCSLLRKLESENITLDIQVGLNQLHRLTTEEEQTLIKKLALYPHIIERAALAYEPHQLALYLRELASTFHAYYNTHRVLVEDPLLCQARLCLSLSVQQILANGLTIMGISAPSEM